VRQLSLLAAAVITIMALSGCAPKLAERAVRESTAERRASTPPRVAPTNRLRQPREAQTQPPAVISTDPADAPRGTTGAIDAPEKPGVAAESWVTISRSPGVAQAPGVAPASSSSASSQAASAPVAPTERTMWVAILAAALALGALLALFLRHPVRR
jgi:hypothetical protein